MPDPTVFAVVALLAVAAAYGAIVFHGLLLADRPFVRRARGVIAYRFMRTWWGRNFLLPGLPALLPFGVGGLIGLAGVAIAGRPVRFERIPGSIGDDLMVMGATLFVLAAVIVLAQPDRVLPDWYRAELRLADEGAASGLPPARQWTEVATTPTRKAILAIAALGCVVAVVAFSVPVIWIAIAVLVVAGVGERLLQ